MNEKLASIMIHIKAYGLEKFEITLPYAMTKLSLIDEFTFGYESEEDFFPKNKSRIMNKSFKIIKEKNIVPPQDISLAEEGIYIQMKHSEERYAPIFSKIKIEEQEYATIAVVGKRLLKGRIYDLYKIDKNHQKDKEYESIFHEMNGNLIEKLEMGLQVTEKEIMDILSQMNKKDYFYSIVRFALSNKNTLDIISKKGSTYKENNHNIEESRIRMPYKD